MKRLIFGVVELVIQMKNVSWKRDKHYILQDINWHVRAGEHWAIIGLNGSGKTTLLNLVNGYIWPSEGEISVLGARFGRCDLRELRKSIGWVSSSLQEKLYGHEAVVDIVLSGKYATIGLYNATEQGDFLQAMGLLEQLGCADLAQRSYDKLSQGEKQKVLIARGLIGSPRLLILDEPCTGLDIFAREQLLTFIQQIGTMPASPTLLFVSHHTEEIMPLFSNLLLLRRGQVYSAGPIWEGLTSDNLSQFLETKVEVSRVNDRAWLRVVTD